jgi:hypothetical protein
MRGVVHTVMDLSVSWELDRVKLRHVSMKERVSSVEGVVGGLGSGIETTYDRYFGGFGIIDNIL